MYKTILVPYDGSAVGAQALPIAAALADRTGASLHVAFVHDPSMYIPFVPGEVAIPVYDAGLVQLQRQQDLDALNGAVADLARGTRAVTGQLLEGTVVEALVEHAAAIGADLTVMTSHGRSGFARLRLGSTASAYLTRTTTPVLVVRAAEGEAPPELPTGPLVCALDGSPFAEAVLPHAITFATACGLSMQLLTVTVPMAMPMAPFGAETLLVDEDALNQEAQQFTSYLTKLASECPPNTTVHSVTDMSVARALVDNASRQSAGAIAMATHGRGGIKRLLLGSVADEVLRLSHMPILVVRPVE